MLTSQKVIDAIGPEVGGQMSEVNRYLFASA
jgi:hypothetical protein